MKKKIFVIAMLLCILSIAVGSTIAYLTDKSTSEKVYTIGNVRIELIENVDENQKLLPATGSIEDGTLQNALKYEIAVKNIGSETAYIRIHVAIPEVLDEGKLHLIVDSSAKEEGQWLWEEVEKYTCQIDGIQYNVYAITYQNSLDKNQSTDTYAISSLYLDSSLDNADIEAINEVLSNHWQIKVIAEATQSAGFENAKKALNTSFGEIGTYTPFK